MLTNKSTLEQQSRTQTGEENEKNIVSVDDAIRYLEDQGWSPIHKTVQYFTEEEIEEL